MRQFFVLLLFLHVASAVKHSLKYFLTATSGIPDFPEFVGAAVVDDIQVGYCDSNIKTAEPKQEWMRKLIKNDPQHQEWYALKCFGNQRVFRDNIDNLKQRLNQTGVPAAAFVQLMSQLLTAKDGQQKSSSNVKPKRHDRPLVAGSSIGVHILQRMNGCDWDDETGEVIGYNQYGYDGEDFISLDLKSLTWVAPRPQAFLTKLRWDTEKARLEYNKNYYIHKCPDWLKKYVNHGRRFLQRTELPSVSLLQKTSSSPVSCHATGFYPDRAALMWRKDGVEHHEDVDHGEILPNHDGTFQMSVELNISSVAPEDWGRYDCVFQLSGVTDDIVTKLDKAVIRTNEGSSSWFPAGPVIGALAGLLLLSVCVAGLVFICKRNNDGFEPANSSVKSEEEAELQ